MSKRVKKTKKVKKTRKICRRRRKEGEIATARTAIRNHCLECMGYNSGEVNNCTSKTCWLFPYRLGSRGIDSECERLQIGETEAVESTK